MAMRHIRTLSAFHPLARLSHATATYILFTEQHDVKIPAYTFLI